MNKTKVKEFIRAAKFLIISISAGIIQFASFALLNGVFNIPEWIANIISLVLSVLWNFTFNRKFTFKSANNVPLAMMKVAMFYVVFTPLTTWGGNLLSLRGINEYLILFGTMGLNLTSEFLYDRFFVFRDTINTNKRAQKKQGGQTT